MLNTYTVQVIDHPDAITRESGFFATVEHYPAGGSLQDKVDITRSEGWATTEDEAVAKAIRNNCKLREGE